MKIVVHSSWEELRPLAQDWNMLLSSSLSDTIFLTWEWCTLWWKHYGCSRPLRVLTAWEGKDLVGVAPFYIDRQWRWGCRWNCVRLVGDGSKDSDYLDCFVRKGSEQAVASAFLASLQELKDKWEWVDFHGTPENSVCLAAMLEEATQRGWKTAVEPIPCATLALPSSWEDYLKMLQPRFRTKVRSCLSHLEQHLRSVPVACHSDADIEGWLPLFFELHARRWQSRSQPGVFRDSSKRLFYHDISRSTLAQGWLAFHKLDWGARPIALQYGFHYHDRFYLLQEAYDPEFETLRPGLMLRAWLIRKWISQGLKDYDFLAGAAVHKMDWGAHQKFSVRTTIAPRWSGAWIAIDGPRAHATIKDKVRKITPRPILAQKKRFLLWRAGRRRDQQESGGVSSAQVLRWGASQLYRQTPLGRVTRYTADRYQLANSSSRGLAVFRLKRRATPACHIFVYHRVNDERDPFFYAFPVSMFRAQMEHLARHFSIITLDQLAEGDFSVDGDKYHAAVTFDDGYRDNFLCAFPILRELGIPATVFLATGYIDTGTLSWYDRVRLAFKITMQSHIALGEMSGPDSSLDLPELRLQALAHSLIWLRGLEESSRLVALRELFRALGVPDSLSMPNVMLNWDDIRRMSREGITFGAHTITHPVLASIDRTRLEEEIYGSKKAIENRLQLPVRHFAYPFGKHSDFSREAKHVVQAAGFTTAVTTISGVNYPTHDPLELKRFCLREPDPGIFGLKLDWYRMSAKPAG
jgi:peptidoglycan/xylan/chitin deacetylase (PgdA/CDA1 family)/CelD/BcsL family acetyltransferase involved in cellulose biosynthesis